MKQNNQFWQRRGFTLVELLTVIAIIGILAGLLLPAVGMMLERSRSMQCQSRLRSLAQAATGYHSSKGQLPGLINKYGNYVPQPAGSGNPNDPNDPTNTGTFLAHVKVGGYGVPLLFYLDQEPVWNTWNENKFPIARPSGGALEDSQELAGAEFHPLAGPSIATFQCPSNTVVRSNIGLNSYAPNAGMSHLYGSTSAGAPTGFTMGFARTYNTRNALFSVKYFGQFSGAAPPSLAEGKKMTLEDASDGLNNTMMYAENVQAYPWFRPGFLNAVDLTNVNTNGELIADAATASGAGFVSASGGAPVWNALLRGRFSTGINWHFEDPGNGGPTLNTNRNILPTFVALNGAVPYVDPYHKVNGDGEESENMINRTPNYGDCYHFGRPSSVHPGGVNIVMSDSSNKFITESIDYKVYQAMLTPNGKKSDVPQPNFILTDELAE